MKKMPEIEDAFATTETGWKNRLYVGICGFVLLVCFFTVGWGFFYFLQLFKSKYFYLDWFLHGSHSFHRFYRVLHVFILLHCLNCLAELHFLLHLRASTF